MKELDRQSVLITGASSGIGAAATHEMADRGWTVFAGVREAGSAPAAINGSTSVHEIELDVTSEGSIAAAAEAITSEAGGSLGGVVNNAGIPGAGPVETVPIEDVRAVIDTNLIGCFAVTQAVLPLIRRSRGRVVFVSSLGGRVAFPYAAPYHASKWGLEGLAESLRAELRPQGVAVSLIEPAAMETEIWSKGRAHLDSVRAAMTPEQLEVYGEELTGFEERLKAADADSADPAKVAASIAAALTEGSPDERYLVGPGAATMTLLHGLLPAAVFDRITQRFAASGS